MKFQQLLKRLKATVRKNNRKDIMKKKYDIEKIKKATARKNKQKGQMI
jgi:hypothetical protein